MTGRPVDIEIVTKDHALLSASSAERWLICTPSARIEEAIGDEESDYAADGTAAHALAEVRLRYLLGRTTKAEYEAAYAAARKLYDGYVIQWDQSDWDSVTSYVDYVMEEYARIGGQIEIEKRVDYSTYAQGGFGTSDALIINRQTKVIKSIDLKFGKGVPVSALENPQAKLYALGGFLSMGLPPHADFSGWTVEWTIHQPRLDSVDSDSASLPDLLDWAENVVRPRAELAWKGEGPKVPSEKGCRFCKAKATCRERAAQNMLIARRDFMGDPDLRFDAKKLDEHLMGMDELGKILPQLDEFIAWANAAKKYALEQATSGKMIPGHKLVRGRSNRSYKPGIDPKASMLAMGLTEGDIVKPGEVRSPAQMEARLGKAEYAKKVAPFVHMPPGSPVLVPDSDRRQAIDGAAEALADFGPEFGEANK